MPGAEGRRTRDEQQGPFELLREALFNRVLKPEFSKQLYQDIIQLPKIHSPSVSNQMILSETCHTVTVPVPMESRLCPHPGPGPPQILLSL